MVNFSLENVHSAPDNHEFSILSPFHSDTGIFSGAHNRSKNHRGSVSSLLSKAGINRESHSPIRLHNTRIHPRVSNLASKVAVNHKQMEPKPRIIETRKKEAKYQKALKNSWMRTFRLIGMPLNTPLPVPVEERNETVAKKFLNHVITMDALDIGKREYLFVQPISEDSDFNRLFVNLDCSKFEIIDEFRGRVMFVAETLGLLSKTLKTKKICGLCDNKLVLQEKIMHFDRSAQPYEASFMSASGHGVFHASRFNTHDVIITDFYNDICYLVRTDSGRYPRFYNLVNAKTQEVMCRLTKPLPPEDNVIGNFDVWVHGTRVAKIRQGGLRKSRLRDCQLTQHHYGIQMTENLDAQLKGLLVILMMNAHFTFSIAKEINEMFNYHDVKTHNPDLWMALYPEPGLGDPKLYWDRHWLNYVLFFMHPLFKKPKGFKYLESGSIIIDTAVFFTEEIETKYADAFEYPAVTNQTDLPYVREKPEIEYIRNKEYYDSKKDIPPILLGLKENRN